VSPYSCKEVGNWTSQPPTTAQHHVVACNYINSRPHTLRHTHNTTNLLTVKRKPHATTNITATFSITDSGGASAVKEPGHLKVRKSSSQVSGCTFFLQKVDDLFSRRALKTQAANAADCFMVKIKPVGYGNIFIFRSHYYRSKAIGRAEPGRLIFQPGRALV